jgi:hypothetical protein
LGVRLPELSGRLQHTSAVFLKPIHLVFARVQRPDGKVERLPADQPYFPVSISYRSVHITSHERALYRPFVELVVSLAHRLRRLQAGNVQMLLALHFSRPRAVVAVLEVRAMKRDFLRELGGAAIDF